MPRETAASVRTARRSAGKFEESKEEEMKAEKDREMCLEQEHLKTCLEIIRENIRAYQQKISSYKKEVTELYQAVRKGEGDSYGQLTAGKNILEYTENALRKNRAALKKAYFGRIDYEDITYGMTECRYIGKNGVTRNADDVVIVDWRAPVSSVYYENELGEGTYEVPDGGTVEVDLKKKRTFDIAGETLLGFYDDDVAANDELLVKYLSQNKEAVLGDIIATIQKEQNRIIRDIPYKNMIVQGVAGSGKTTVALHRISYILYNYEDKFKPSEFCIIGGSDMLLNYISSGLPELDVNHVSQLRMDRFFPYLMGKSWKKSFRLVPDDPMAGRKSHLDFAERLDRFLRKKRQEEIPDSDIRDRDMGVILSRENVAETLLRNPHLSLFQTEKLLNERLASRIRFLCTERDQSFRKEKLLSYKKYFDTEKKKWTPEGIYLEFLEMMAEETSAKAAPEGKTEEISGGWAAAAEHVRAGNMDVYDAAALALIWKRLFMKKQPEEFSQIIIDEAQDFGEMVYYVMRELLEDCCFTIMGDVSQNIRYETGMNDWEDLKKIMLRRESDSFYLLSKSYRNTIEISEYAGRVLKQASQETYRIQPVIRHGRDVSVFMEKQGEAAECLRNVLKDVQERGYETAAVICRTQEEAREVREFLGMEQGEEMFRNGIMVLPVTAAKGLEFDAVILWQPDEERYGLNVREAKLLYVAITRALHELYLIGDGTASRLLEKEQKKPA